MSDSDPAKTGTGDSIDPDTGQDVPVSGANKLFDLRLLIGGLFTMYGVVLTIVGIVDSGGQLHKASDVRINLWMGLGMLLLGLFFLAWVRLRPLHTSGAPGRREDS